MPADVDISRLDVVREYNSKLKNFRMVALACGALIDKQIRKIKSQMEEKKNFTKSCLNSSKESQRNMANRYKPIRTESLPNSQVAGDTDHQIDAKVAALESAINEYNRMVDDINNKITEIGQRTKTFCTILDSETMSCNQKMEDMIAIMEQYSHS